MSTYTAQLVWERGTQDFLSQKYSRRHRIRFDGGAEILASSSPAVVPVPASDPAGIDPEEAFVASLSSCHMLWFLFVAGKRGFVVDRYEDNPTGVLERNAERRWAISVVTLHPMIAFAADKQPSASELEQMHQKAHEECYIANSVKTDVRIEPVAG
jgi:organic hydroperoxide reductase OsmC/OhrA